MTSKTKRFPYMARRGLRRKPFRRVSTPLSRLMNHMRRPLIVKRSTAAGNKVKRAAKQSMGSSAVRSRGVHTG